MLKKLVLNYSGTPLCNCSAVIAVITFFLSQKLFDNCSTNHAFGDANLNLPLPANEGKKIVLFYDLIKSTVSFELK